MGVIMATKRKKRVVIVHALEDKLDALRLSKELRSFGLNTWLDEEQLFRGQRWEDELSQAIAEADGILLLISPNAASRGGRLQEQLLYALTATRTADWPGFLIPVRLGFAPEAESNILMPRSGHIDLFPSWEDGLKHLLETIERPPSGPSRATNYSSGERQVSPPAVFIGWDPEALSPGEYVELVAALGDLVRAEGGIGIERLNDGTFEVILTAGVLA
jgi:hypothetical protein